MYLSQSSDASTSTSPTRTADQAEWEFVKPSESPAWSVESLGPVPSAEEAREATRYMVESLTGSVVATSLMSSGAPLRAVGCSLHFMQLRCSVAIEVVAYTAAISG